MRHWIQRVLLSGWLALVLALLSLLVVLQLSRSYGAQQRGVIERDTTAALQTSSDAISMSLRFARDRVFDAADAIGMLHPQESPRAILERTLDGVPAARCVALWTGQLTREWTLGDCTAPSLVWARSDDAVGTAERIVLAANGSPLVLFASPVGDGRLLLAAIDASVLAEQSVHRKQFVGHRFALLVEGERVWGSDGDALSVPERAQHADVSPLTPGLSLASWPRHQMVSAVVTQPVAVIWVGGGLFALLLGGLVFAAQRATLAETRSRMEVEIRKEQDRELEALNRDLEQRVAARTLELQRSNQDLEQFAYVASHDLQEPLRMVVSYLQLLNEEAEAKLTPREREYVHFAVDGARRLRQLVHGLLQYSRVGTHGAEFEWIALEDVVNDALSGLALQVRERNAEIRLGVLPKVFGDRTQLMMLFRNLIANGIKYSEGTPRIWISVDETRVNYTFRVRDEGIGIPPEHRKKVFRLFQRLHTREQYPGTGIGLALVKRIVDRHNGTIRIESPEQGQGTCVVFALPRGVVQPFDTAAAMARENAAIEE